MPSPEAPFYLQNSLDDTVGPLATRPARRGARARRRVVLLTFL